MRHKTTVYVMTIHGWQNNLGLRAFFLTALLSAFLLEGVSFGQSDAELEFDDFDSPQSDSSDNGPKFGAPAQELPPNTRVEDVVQPSAQYHYAGFGKPDPFTPPVFVRSVVPDAVEIPIVSPLQRFSLGELKLGGVWVRGGGEKKALILTPTMEGIIVKVGDMVGNGGGRITNISDGAVMIREFLIANDGTRQFSDASLTFEKSNTANLNATGKSGVIVIKPGATSADVELNNADGTTGKSGGVGINSIPANLLPAAPAGGVPASMPRR